MTMTILSGKKDGENKAKELRDWIESHITYDEKGNPSYEQFREYVYRNNLSRAEIKRELNFGDSTLKTNRGAVTALKDIEDKLRAAGILPPKDEKPTNQKPEDMPEKDRGKAQSNHDKQRLNQLEQQNAALRAEVFDLKAKLKELNVIDEFLLETGRMPR